MYHARVVGCAFVAAILLSLLINAPSASASVIWTGTPSKGTAVFKLLNLEDSAGNSTANPSPNGSSITTGTDPTYGSDFVFFKAAADLRAEAHGASGFTPEPGSTYYLGWRFKVNSTVSDNAIFQWKAYGGTLEQNFPIVLSFNNGFLQLAYYAPPSEDRNVLWTQSEPANQWEDVVLEIKVSQLNTTSGSGAGAISFWFNGIEENLAGQGTTYVGSTFDGTSVDPKWGIYGAVGTQVTDDVTDLKIGTTYADAAPTSVPEPVVCAGALAIAACFSRGRCRCQ